MKYDFSFIVPVFNRPMEIDELLASFSAVKGINNSEIIIIEDGSQNTCKGIVNKYCRNLNISYYYKKNSGPGTSRNYGMTKANSDYFIILDSDVILPEDYLIKLNSHLKADYADCYGGPDAAHVGFSNLQKAINYSMTSFWTTGGIRGKKSAEKSFQPRSFNMGISRKAFEASGGFSNIHPGEDPDLALRLKKLKFKTSLYENCFVYHKRRVSWRLFYNQMRKFGLVRPILNVWHPDSHKIIFYFPTVFCMGLIMAVLFMVSGFYGLIILYVLYFVFLFIDALNRNKSVIVASLAVYAVLVQFTGYGMAFLRSTFKLFVLKIKPEKAYPELFFKKIV
jgi:glycosyltransferase involved in cell wall biosynthesis